MAKLKGPFEFSGTLKGISAYTMRGCEEVILRTAYGPSKKEIAQKAAYDITRRNNAEFGGRSTAAVWVRKAFHLLKPVADYNHSGPINTLLKVVQQMDTESEFGQRHVLLSQAPHLLEGFNFNSRHLFDSVIRNPVSYTVLREGLEASIEFPALLPSFTFFPPGAHPCYRILATLGVVPDLFYAQPRYRPEGVYEPFLTEQAWTDWYAVKTGSPELELKLKLPFVPENQKFSLLLSAGIQMGTVQAAEIIRPVPYTGCGKILAVK
jgi:hypothetical protein